MLTNLDAPGTTDDITYDYDVTGRLLDIDNGTASRRITNTYDILGRLTRAATHHGNVDYDYDLAGRRTKMTWPDAFYVNYDYDDAGMLTKIRENGAVSGVGVLASFQYNGLGQRIKTTRGNGTDTDYSFTSSTPPLTDGLLPTQLDHDFAGTADDLSVGFEYNPAGQITMRDSDNDAYSYDAFASVTIASVNNALNQTTSVGGVSTTHDNRGNMTNDGTHAYIYDALNRMTRRAVGEVLQYDAFNRLFQAEDGAAKRRFLYDGSEIIAEMTTAGVIEKRYVRGPGADEVLVEYDTTGVSDVRTWLYADERGSIIAGANDSGTKTFINTYDEFGNPASTNTGSFQYTGQLWLSEVELYHYKARQYNPEIGRFMQTDPIGYGDGMNMYNYVGSDPVNGVDPSGLSRDGDPELNQLIDYDPNYGDDVIIVTGTRISDDNQLGLWSSGNGNNVLEASIFDGATIGDPTGSDAGLRSKDIDAIAIDGWHKKRLGGERINYRLRYPKEQLWVIMPSGEVIYLGIIGSGKPVNVPSGYVAIFHSHPKWSAAGPGPGDFDERVPIYGFSQSCLWRLQPGEQSETVLRGNC